MHEPIFKPSREMTFATVLKDSESLIKYCTDKSLVTLRVDLAQVVFCDSAGLALLIKAKRLAIAHKKSYQLLNIPTFVRSMAEFSGVESMLELNEKREIKREKEIIND